jgi:hypothetical protein
MTAEVELDAPLEFFETPHPYAGPMSFHMTEMHSVPPTSERSPELDMNISACSRFGVILP